MNELSLVQSHLDSEPCDMSLDEEAQKQDELEELILQEEARTEADRKMQNAEIAELHAKIDHAKQAAELYEMQAKRADEQASQLSSAMVPANARRKIYKGIMLS